MSNITEEIDTKPFHNLADSIHNLESTIGNLTNVIHNISNYVNDNITKISIPSELIIIGIIVYFFVFLICYNCNFLCKKVSKRIYPTDYDNN